MTRTNRTIKPSSRHIPIWSNNTDDFVDLSTVAKNSNVGEGYITSSDGWLLVASTSTHGHLNIYVNEVIFTSPSNINNQENTVTIPVRRGDKIRYTIYNEAGFGKPNIVRFYPTS